MAHLERWIIGFMVAALGLFGLYVASRATDDVMYGIGIVFFIGAVLFNFFQINAVYSKKKSHSS